MGGTSKEYDRRYYQANRERIRAYRLANRERILARQLRYRREVLGQGPRRPKQPKAPRQPRVRTLPSIPGESAAEYARRYYWANRERIRARQLAYNRSRGVGPRVPAFRWNRQRARWLFLANQVPGCLEPRRCKDCQRWFPPADVRLSDRRCRSCSKENLRAWRAANPDKAKASRKAAKHRRRARLAGSGGSHTEAEWISVLSRWDHRCARCGKGGEMTRDHVIPLSHGGSNDWTNLQPMCHLCNSLKSAVLTGAVQACIPGVLTIR